MRATDLQNLCKECAASIYGATPPTPAYAKRVGDILLGTAATESHFKYRRQRGYDMSSARGAFGLWQTEALPMADNLLYLKRRADVRSSACRFLGVSGDMAGILGMGTHGLLHLIHDWDRLAVLMARIHYMRFPKPVPESLGGQAEYYKTHYNTVAGKGSAAKYIDDWNRLVVPATGA